MWEGWYSRTEDAAASGVHVRVVEGEEVKAPARGTADDPLHVGRQSLVAFLWLVHIRKLRGSSAAGDR